MPVLRLTAQLLSITLKPIYNMKILESFHRPTRIKGGTIDSTPLLFNPNDELYQPNPFATEAIEYPIYYYAKVQVCVCHLFWVTVWSATVELTDAAIDAVNKSAREVADMISCTGL